MRKFYFIIFILVVLFLVSCKDNSPSSPTTTTTTPTTTPTTTVSSTSSVIQKPVVIRETGEGFDTIQEAVDAASVGQHIDVAPGTYVENVVINKKIYLIGADRVTTIIHSDGAYPGVIFNPLAKGSEIRGFTVLSELKLMARSYNNRALSNVDIKQILPFVSILCEADSVNIERVITRGGWGGVLIHNASGGKVCGVIAKKAFFGVFVSSANYSIMEVRAVENGIGIYCEEDCISSISGCIIENNELYGICCGNGAHPDIGGGVWESPGDNCIRGNGEWDLYNETSWSLFARQNLWDHFTASEIDSQDIYDDDESWSGEVYFVPFKVAVATSFSKARPRLFALSSLFKGFFHSLFRADLPASGVYIPPSLKTRVWSLYLLGTKDRLPYMPRPSFER